MSTIAIAPEVTSAVAAFLAAVRTHLADLDPEEQREILDGLEADLTELVAEQGASALGDPVAYALELRTAAGIEEAARRRRPIRAAVETFLDACHARFDALAGRLPQDPAPLLTWARPLWWVARAWLAVQLVDLMTEGGAYAQLVPNLRGFGWLLLIVAILGSVQLGRGRIWPGGRRGVLARLALLGLNVLALVVAIPAADALNNDQRYWDGYQQGMEEAGNAYGSSGTMPIDEQDGVYSSGQWVSNIYPYDAQGRPLVGVQLFDQAGKPIKVVTRPDCEPTSADPRPQAPTNENGEMGYCIDHGYDLIQPRVFYPWTNGAAQLFNVFPLPSRVQVEAEPSTNAFAEKNKPSVGSYPMAQIPPVSLPGIKTGVQRTR